MTGEPALFFSYKDYGIERYGQSIIVHEDTLAQNPDLVRRFITGYLMGVRYVLENPWEVAEIVKKYVPEVDSDLTIKSWQLEADVAVSEESRGKGLGWMSRDRMVKTIQLIMDAYEVQKEILPEEIYTTEFLPAEPIYPPVK